VHAAHFLCYATGQFGKNHQGDRDEQLPTANGFDEFLGNLYHLDAEEEPENEDYPAHLVLANGKKFEEVYGPRGVLKCKADGKCEDTGPLTKKRMETVDEETVAVAQEFIGRQNKAGKPFFVWWNATRVHFRTHVKAQNRHKGNDKYSDGMIEDDGHVGQLLKQLDDLGIATRTGCPPSRPSRATPPSRTGCSRACRWAGATIGTTSTATTSWTT